MEKVGKKWNQIESNEWGNFYYNILTAANILKMINDWIYGNNFG